MSATVTSAISYFVVVSKIDFSVAVISELRVKKYNCPINSLNLKD